MRKEIEIRKKIIAIRCELKELSRLEAIASEAECEYIIFPEDTETENAFDLAYKNEFTQFMLVSAMISELIGIDEKTARAMVNGKRTDLEKILTA